MKTANIFSLLFSLLVLAAQANAQTPATQPGAFTASSAIVYTGQTNVTYTVPAATGVTYTWNYSGTGDTINGSGNSVTVTYSTAATSGTLSVTAANTASPATPSAPRSIAVTVKPYETWTGSGNTNWNNAANWDGGFIPYATISTYIPASAALQPAIGSNASSYNLTTENSSIISIAAANILSVNGDLNLNGNVTGSGKINLCGNYTQQITGKGRVDNMQLQNTNGANIHAGDTIHIGSTYTPAIGTLTTNGGLELLADSNGTASVLTNTGWCNYISGEVTCGLYIPGGRRAFRFLGHPFSQNIGIDQLEKYIDITGQGGAANGFTTTNSNNPSAFWYNTTTGNGSSTNDSTGWVPFTSTTDTGDNAWYRYNGLRILVRGAKGQGLGCNACVPQPVTVKMHGPINECD